MTFHQLSLAGPVSVRHRQPTRCQCIGIWDNQATLGQVQSVSRGAGSLASNPELCDLGQVTYSPVPQTLTCKAAIAPVPPRLGHELR